MPPNIYDQTTITDRSNIAIVAQQQMQQLNIEHRLPNTKQI